MTSTTYHHIELDEAGVPWISGAQVKVVEIALDRIAYAWDAQEIRREHPQLSLSQIHSALAYYFDHQDAIDRDIEERIAREKSFFTAHPPSALIRQKLLQAKNTP